VKRYAKQPNDKGVDAFYKTGSMQALIDAMNVFKLPRNIPVVAYDVNRCNVENAFYSPDDHSLNLCYPLAKSFYDSFRAHGYNDADAGKATMDALVFTTLHEMGHALINELGVGVTGKEEDAVDEFAAVVLISNKKPEWAINGPLALVFLFSKYEGQHPPFFDEHAMSKQRLGDILCMVYGSDPKKFAPDMNNWIKQLGPDGQQLVERAPKCAGFYQQKDKAWTNLLKPYYR